MDININLVTNQVCTIVKVLEDNEDKLHNCKNDANKLLEERSFVALDILKGLNSVAETELDKIIETQDKEVADKD